MLRRLTLYVIAIYQRDVAAGIGAACPQTPSCSEYARQAYESERFAPATRKVFRRLRSCRTSEHAAAWRR